MDNFLQNFNLTDLNWVWKSMFIIAGLYLLTYSFLQVRELGVLQGKVKTSSDGPLKFYSYFYFLIQLVLFVVVLFIL